MGGRTRTELKIVMYPGGGRGSGSSYNRHYSRHAVNTRCLAGQVNYTIGLQYCDQRNDGVIIILMLSLTIEEEEEEKKKKKKKKMCLLIVYCISLYFTPDSQRCGFAAASHPAAPGSGVPLRT